MCLSSDNSKEHHCPFNHHHCSTKAGDKSNKTIDNTDVSTPCNTSHDHVLRRSQSNKGPQQTNGKTQYQCKVCERCFDSKRKQQCHMRIHTSKKPYQCKVCNKGFAQSQNLKVHMRIHTGVKPYQCKVCDKCFSQLHYLKKALAYSHRRETISVQNM